MPSQPPTPGGLLDSAQPGAFGRTFGRKGQQVGVGRAGLRDRADVDQNSARAALTLTTPKAGIRK